MIKNRFDVIVHIILRCLIAISPAEDSINNVMKLVARFKTLNPF